MYTEFIIFISHAYKSLTCITVKDVYNTAKLTGRNVYELASELRKITNSVNAIKQRHWRRRQQKIVFLTNILVGLSYKVVDTLKSD